MEVLARIHGVLNRLLSDARPDVRRVAEQQEEKEQMRRANMDLAVRARAAANSTRRSLGDVRFILASAEEVRDLWGRRDQERRG